jgi:hypothetical protein
MSDTIRFDGTTVNAPQALELAQFYAEITGGLAKGTAHWAAVSTGGALIAFQQVDDFAPPTWPGGSAPIQLHLDFFVDDLEASGARATAAGARLLEVQPNDHCRVFTPTLPATRSACRRGRASSSSTAERPQVGVKSTRCRCRVPPVGAG